MATQQQQQQQCRQASSLVGTVPCLTTPIVPMCDDTSPVLFPTKPSPPLVEASTPGHVVFNKQHPLFSNIRYAVFDTETTGLNTSQDRITQYAIVILQNGIETETHCGLVRGVPEHAIVADTCLDIQKSLSFKAMSIPAKPQELNGISTRMVQQADGWIRHLTLLLDILLRSHVLVQYTGRDFDRRMWLEETKRARNALEHAKAIGRFASADAVAASDTTTDAAMATLDGHHQAIIDYALDVIKQFEHRLTHMPIIDVCTIVRAIEHAQKPFEGFPPRDYYKLANVCLRWQIDMNTARAHRADVDATGTARLLNHILVQHKLPMHLRTPKQLVQWVQEEHKIQNERYIANHMRLKQAVPHDVLSDEPLFDPALEETNTPPPASTSTVQTTATTATTATTKPQPSIPSMSASVIDPEHVVWHMPRHSRRRT